MSDPGASTAIREGHRRLLDAFRGFDLRADGSGPARVDPHELRGLIAFLRHEIGPFSRREEGVLPAGVARESAAFEHAFLAVEVDALAREADALFDALRPGAVRQAEERVFRRSHRIEAALELHVLRTAETAAADGAPAPWMAPAPTADPAIGGPSADRSSPACATARELSRDEIGRFLRSRQWAVLATAAAGRPYAVPVTFVFDGHAFYIASGPGRKVDVLERNPHACITVVDIAEDARWRSVVARGRAQRVRRLSGRLIALARLRARNGDRRRPSPRDAGRLAGARVFRIAPRELTGRAGA